MRYERGHKARMRERLLSEAASVLRSGGPEGLSVVTLMKRAGLTHGGFYVHFTSKDDLVFKAIDHMFVKRQAFIESIETDPPSVALGKIIDSYLRPDKIDMGEDSCPIPSLAGEHGRLPEAAQKRFTIGVQGLIDVVDKLIARVGCDVPPGAAASVVAELVGAAALAPAQGSEESSREFLSSVRRSLRRRLGLDKTG